MFSSNVKNSVERRSDERVETRTGAMYEWSQPGAGTQRYESLSVPAHEENPYAPPRMTPEQSAVRGCLECAYDVASLYVATLIEDAAPTKTSKYVAGFIFCEAAAVLFFSGFYSYFQSSAISVSEAPQLALMAGVSGVMTLLAGLECGIIVSHRMWKGFKETHPPIHRTDT